MEGLIWYFMKSNSRQNIRDSIERFLIETKTPDYNDLAFLYLPRCANEFGAKNQILLIRMLQ